MVTFFSVKTERVYLQIIFLEKIVGWSSQYLPITVVNTINNKKSQKQNYK